MCRLNKTVDEKYSEQCVAYTVPSISASCYCVPDTGLHIFHYSHPLCTIQPLALWHKSLSLCFWNPMRARKHPLYFTADKTEVQSGLAACLRSHRNKKQRRKSLWFRNPNSTCHHAMITPLPSLWSQNLKTLHWAHCEEILLCCLSVCSK